MKKAIETMDCKFCGRPVTLLKTVGTATSYGFYGPTLTMNITEATCKHLALTDLEKGSVLTQHEDLADIEKNHTVVLDTPRITKEFDKSYFKIKDSETI